MSGRRMLNHGCLPRMYEARRPHRLLDACVADYLREEIAAEGLVRNLPAFAGFLDAAALGDDAMVNCSGIARECGVSSNTVKGYFRILAPGVLKTASTSCRRRSSCTGCGKASWRNLSIVASSDASPIGTESVMMIANGDVR